MQSVGGGLTDYSNKEEGFVSRVAGVAGEVYTIVGTAVKGEAASSSRSEPTRSPAPVPKSGSFEQDVAARESTPQKVAPQEFRDTARNSDPSVLEAQETLTALGYDVGKADGIFGSRTSSAIKHYQVSVGLPPNGIIDPKTLAALRRSAASGGKPIAEVPSPAQSVKEPERAKGSLSNL